MSEIPYERDPDRYLADAARTLCVDFDGVIHSFSSGWKGTTNIPDPPMPDALDWLLKMQGKYIIVISSCRARTPEGAQAIRGYMAKHIYAHTGDVEVTTYFMRDLVVTGKKPGALVYIDDKGFRFSGQFPTEGAIEALTRWNKEFLEGDK